MVFCSLAFAEDEAEEEDKDDPPVYEIPPIPVTVLDTIDVVGSSIVDSRETPGSVHRLTAAQIRKQAVAFDDVNRLLFRIPGINIQEEEGYGLRPNIGMRGTAVDRSVGITLMEDAVLMAPAPYSAPSAYYFPIAGRMSGMEVRKGSSQIQYGPRTNGGALNMISTPTPNRFSGEAKISGGQDNTGKVYANIGAGAKYGAFLLETYQIQTNGFKVLDTGGNTGFEIEDYVGKAEINSDPTGSVYHRLSLKVGRTNELSNETYLGLTDADFESTPYRRYAGSQRDVMESEHRQYMLRYLMLAGPVSVTTTAYRNKFHRNWYKLDKVDGTSIREILDDPATYSQEYSYITGSQASPDDAFAVKNNNRYYDSKGVDAVLKTSFDGLRAHHELDFGARFHMDEEDRFQWSNAYRMGSDGIMVKTSSGIPGFSGGGNNRVSSSKAFAGFALERMRLGRLVLTPGVRYEHIEGQREQYAAGDPDRTGTPTTTENTTDVVLPGIGAYFKAGGGASVFGGVHRGFSPPGPGSVDEQLPELSVNYELGTRVDRPRLHMQVIGFFNDYSNLHGRDTFSSGGEGSGELFNAGEVNSYGLETSLGLELLSRTRWGFGMPLGLSYTWTVSEFQNTFSSAFDPWGDVMAGDRHPYVPEHQATASLALEFNHFRVGGMANYIGRTPTEALQGPIPDDKAIPARMIFDATAEVTFAQYYAAFASVQNITGEAYMVARRPAGVRPGLPRRLIAGVKMGF